MKNTYLVYEIKKLIKNSALISAVLFVILALLQFQWLVSAFIFITIQVLYVRYAMKIISKQTELLPKINSLTQNIADGEFEYRITGIDETTELGQVAWTLNDLLDQMEAFSREIKTIVQCISEEKFYRTLQYAGMHGQMLHTMKAVGDAIELTKEKAKSKQEYLINCVHILLENMDEFSKGNLTVHIESNNSDEIGKLYNGFNKVVEATKEIIIAVAEAVQAVAGASTQISSSTEEMSAGAQEQSSQSSEVASAVEQMTRTIIETTKNVSVVSEKAKHSGQLANQGGEIITDTIEGMNKIAAVVTNAANTISALGDSSEKIGNIVDVIDEIAEQTNLLALNAAIEAARAGDQGRGFAVVADEVKKLAERTSEATKEIAGMINHIQIDTKNAVGIMNQGTDEVNNGKQLAGKAEEALKQIINGSAEVVDNITQVASASEEQASAAEQISRSIEGINSVTQESAVGIQQLAMVAEDMNKYTENLQNLVSRFTYDFENEISFEKSTVV
ncbi:MAG: methyl-accepting chemotaxis protein [Melioribacteraceae bacterium]|nr:methyl-accepting chemotaxis protein [Melioribacteraceae bacterium]MCF8354184.1 methyl-accepting chemotaxis protein [Melioribacteraceae bacterium]MCF8394722.1 methyl-accepting chemotaxis protein [Melioribacteraceae bacterium]MCF8418107.1 methyl-accepting chemotaxis protein [Melioribacteraceae bacterium]